jgi:hypothetical protein
MGGSTRERLRGFIERLRLAVSLKRTRGTRVVFAVACTLVAALAAGVLVHEVEEPGHGAPGRGRGSPMFLGASHKAGRCRLNR